MFLSESQLSAIGFKSIGKNVYISDKCSIYNPHNISIGDNVRIDDFVILSPATSLSIGNYVHIACYSSIIGQGNIILEDYVGVSGRVSIYSSSDDYTGMGMTNPMVPLQYRRVSVGDVILRKHTIIGTGTAIMPGVEIGMGTSVYAQSLVVDNCDSLSIYSGRPAIKLKKRLSKFLQYEKNINTTH
jgi:acetyltransferase-like isoleucine patch superfamily enzyme